MRLAQDAHARPRPDDVRVLRPRLRAAVPGDRRAARCSSTSACSRRRRPATAARPPGETIGKAKACYAGGAVQIYLNLAGRDPVDAAALTQVPAADEAATVARIKAAFLALKDPNDWTGDGKPENWKVIDRAYTKAEARYIPNGAKQHRGHVAPDAHRRRGRVLLPAVPVRRGDARHADRPLGVLRPARLRARTCRTCKSNTNMRATFLAGGRRIEDGVARNVRSDRPRADGRVPARRPGAAAQPGRRAARHPRRRPAATRRSRSSGSTTSTVSSSRPRPRSTARTVDRRRRGAARDAVRRGGRGAARPDAAAGGG